MKLDRIIWGVLLLFIGTVLLLQNFDIIDFYWRNVWSFWPVFLIIAGVNMLFNKNNSQLGNVLSLVILVITLGFLFFKGQERPGSGKFWNSLTFDNNRNSDDNLNRGIEKTSTFTEIFQPGDELKKHVLEISGGGTSIDLEGTTDSLFIANVKHKRSNFALTKYTTDSVNTIVFKHQDKHKGNKWSFGDGSSNVELMLNDKPIWDMEFKMGAGEIDFDVKKYKVRTLNFDGGAAAVKFKVGDLLPITDVNIKTGVADVKIEVPQASGCRITSKTGLSSKDFEGFIKVSDGVYETANYGSSTNKVFINFDGGLSSFVVKRY